MRAVNIQASAQLDLQDAADWYEEKYRGLGQEFLEEIDEVFDVISRRPRQFPPIVGQARRALVKRFPYAIYFHEQDDEIEVFAVLHQRADDRRWRERLKMPDEH